MSLSSSNLQSSQHPRRSSSAATTATLHPSYPTLALAGPSISSQPDLPSAFPTSDHQYQAQQYSSLAPASSTYLESSINLSKPPPVPVAAHSSPESQLYTRVPHYYPPEDPSQTMMMSQRDLGYGYMPSPLHNPMHSYSHSQPYQSTLAPLPGYYSDSQHRSLSGSSRPSILPIIDHFPSFGAEERDQEDPLSRKRRRLSQQQDARRQSKLRVRKDRLPSIVDLGGDGSQVLSGPVDVYPTAPSSSSAYVHESVERAQLRPSMSPPFRNDYSEVLPGPPSSYISQPYHHSNYSMGPMNPSTLAPPHPPAHPNSNGGYSSAGRSSPLLQAPLPPASSSSAVSPHVVEPVVLDRREKPQCWDHGCNGREFSTFSNLLRHQREKSGSAAKSYCTHCGAEFTRTTARNGHVENGKCKTRRPSDTSNRG